MKRKQGNIYLWVLCCIFFVSTLCSGEEYEEIFLKNEKWSISIRPSTLQVKAFPEKLPEYQLSDSLAKSQKVQNLIRDEKKAKWEFPEKGISISCELAEGDFFIKFRSQNQGEFSWPFLSLAKPCQALIWPRWEGCYIPVEDPIWQNHLLDMDWNTLDGLCMPFWGLDCKDYTLTFIALNRYNNTIRFNRIGNQLQMQFLHEYPPSKTEWEYGFKISLGNPSPVEPARQFRRWIVERGEFVDMKEKMKTIPRVEWLLGAPHVYLWGGELFTRHDVIRNLWKSWCRKMIEESGRDSPSPGKQIKELMAPQHWEEILEISKLEWPYNYIKNEVAIEISRILERKDFFNEESWKSVSKPKELLDLISRNPDSLSLPEIIRRNTLLLKAAYSEELPEVNDWGDGVSVKMLKKFQEAGFDRVRFCLDGWAEIEKHPEIAKTADRMGYLFGTYDSYHSIHDPSLAGTDATWTTAQFDRDLYEKGPIVGRDGKKKTGFKGKGYKISPKAARPYLEKRVNRIMSCVPFNYYFVDCDAYGEVYDDYSPLHPASQEQDALARNDRLKWISNAHGVVIGSEGGSSYAASVVHLVEGMFGPGFGWGDPDLKDKASKYFLGRFYPPDAPEVFIKQVPLKEKYYYLYYDPRFRLPLYEVVFHDSVVTTHQWGNGSLKFLEISDIVSLTEILYQVPPLYHMNLDEFQKHKQGMIKHYKFFSPLHRKLGFSQMTDFSWLSPDRLIQKTVFEGNVEIVANFKKESCVYGGMQIPGRSILARWPETGKSILYTPNSD